MQNMTRRGDLDVSAPLQVSGIGGLIEHCILKSSSLSEVSLSYRKTRVYSGVRVLSITCFQRLNEINFPLIINTTFHIKGDFRGNLRTAFCRKSHVDEDTAVMLI